MRIRSWILVGLVAVLLITAYWAVIGFGSPIPDFNNGRGGNPPATVTYIAFATFHLTTTITTLNAYGHPLNPAIGDISSFSSKVEKFVNPNQGKVYQNIPLLTAHPRPSETWGTYWINITISGPNGFMSYWQSSGGLVLFHSSTDPQYNEIFTGRCMFSENGIYSAKAELHATYGLTGESSILDTYTISVEVNV